MTAATPRPPTTAQANRLQQAAMLLSQGKPRDALLAVRALALELPGVGKVQHLLALCLKACGELDAARRAFEIAESLDPKDAQLLANHANLLLTMGNALAALDKYRISLVLEARNAETWINFSIALLRTGDTAGALEAATRATGVAPQWPAAWHALGAAQRTSGDLEAATFSLRKAVELDPNNPPLQLALGVVERMQGRAGTALAHYDIAVKLGMQTPELLDARVAALLDEGNVESATELARQLVELHPRYAPGQLMLAEILWEYSPSTDAALEHIRGLLDTQTDQPGLRRSAAELLLAARQTEPALATIKDLRRREDGADLAALEAEAHWQNNDAVRALETLADAPEQWRRSVVWRRTQVRMLLAARRPEHAANAAIDTLAWAGYDQALLALLGTAWRMTEDPRENWLCNYDRFVKVVDLDVSEWISDLAGQLHSLHRARSAPLRQSLRAGTQTAGNLLGRDEPAIARLRTALQLAITQTLKTLPEDAAHPFLCRNTVRSRFVGSWSAKLAQGGRHVNHFHQEGWLSSAFYVELPHSVTTESATNAGCLQFGQPDEQLRLVHLRPRHIIRPKIGRLVLFPSYLWHGTVPFDDAATRLTVAFDAQPI